MLQVPTLLTDAHQLMDALHEKSARYMSSLYCSAQLLHRYGDLGGVSSWQGRNLRNPLHSA